ncbi:MAG: DUF4149 domain-containing protein [Rhodocyclales bacterium]|nr:DUF4149 domain-containing protein [Rhodocyclales bacterium]
MMRFADALYSLCITIWVGGLLAVGYLVAPILFAQLADRALAGHLAGHMFAAVAWVGIACATYLSFYLLALKGWRAVKSGMFWIVLLMLALTLAGHFGVQPILEQLKADALPRQVMESAMRDRFATWHGVSSILYLVQSLLGIVLLLLQDRGRGH